MFWPCWPTRGVSRHSHQTKCVFLGYFPYITRNVILCDTILMVFNSETASDLTWLKCDDQVKGSDWRPACFDLGPERKEMTLVTIHVLQSTQSYPAVLSQYSTFFFISSNIRGTHQYTHSPNVDFPCRRFACFLLIPSLALPKPNQSHSPAVRLPASLCIIKTLTESSDRGGGRNL